MPVRVPTLEEFLLLSGEVNVLKREVTRLKTDLLTAVKEMKEATDTLIAALEGIE